VCIPLATQDFSRGKRNMKLLRTIFTAALLGAISVPAGANVLTWGPSQGTSDSAFDFIGSLTYSGSSLTGWDLKAVKHSNNAITVYEWTPGNSTFLMDPDYAGALITVSSDGTFSHDRPSVWLYTGSSGSSFADLTGSA